MALAGEFFPGHGSALHRHNGSRNVLFAFAGINGNHNLHKNKKSGHSRPSCYADRKRNNTFHTQRDSALFLRHSYSWICDCALQRDEMKRRTTISLEEELLKELKNEARKRDVPLSWIVEKSLEKAIRKLKR
ncbi:hypothetical protein DRJ16_00035 [Candidatus Woesearchaeota archaeon]|nr:MAG: hypothetical protein DRJ16_00035 [Candidatus Woesearchaeota archaeon]